MKLFLLTVLLATAAFAKSIATYTPLHLFSNPESTDDFNIPSVHESAIQARRVLHLSPIGTLSTVFPNGSYAMENRPSGMAGAPIGLMDYIADCESSTGNPTILAISIATAFKNVAAGSNISLSLRWWPEDGKWHSAANLPRFSLIGHLEDISKDEVSKQGIRSCFVKTHPDSIAWQPGNRIHESHYVKLVVEEVYWIGGFGDRAYIGWIPIDEWQSVTKKEIEGCRLPGEKTAKWWKEWL